MSLWPRENGSYIAFGKIRQFFKYQTLDYNLVIKVSVNIHKSVRKKLQISALYLNKVEKISLTSIETLSLYNTLKKRSNSGLYFERNQI